MLKSRWSNLLDASCPHQKNNIQKGCGFFKVLAPAAASTLNLGIRSLHISQDTWNTSWLTAMSRCTIKTSSQGIESIQMAHTILFFILLKSQDLREVLYLGTFSERNIQIKQSERKEEGKERWLSALCQQIIFNREKDTSGYSFL